MSTLIRRLQVVKSRPRHFVSTDDSLEDDDQNYEDVNTIQTPSPEDSSSSGMTVRAEQLDVVTTPELEMIKKGEYPNGICMDLAEIKASEGMSDDGSVCSVDSINENEFLLGTDEASPGDDSTNDCKPDHAVAELDVAKYMAQREMTPMQERVNAITVVPTFVYCLFFLSSGLWLDQALVDQARDEMINGTKQISGSLMNEFFADENGCVSLSWLPNLHALPPLPVFATGAGIILHAPFSFIYHWFYAHRLPPGFARTDHWSRRMDQAMIHVISACMAYSTSGRLDFFAVNALYNMDCIYRQFKRRVRPRRNQIRIYISVLAYLIPILRRGDFILFAKLIVILSSSGYFFAKYPIGGWSHSVFHLIVALVPPLLMRAAAELPASQDQMDIAAQCAVLSST